MTYFEKLKDPRWQKKRLERLKQSEFSCDNCGNAENELTVHHRCYKKNTDPWDYEDDELVVYCKVCHTSWHDAKHELDKIIGSIDASDLIQRISGYALAISQDVFPADLSTYPSLVGYSDAFRTTPDVVEYLLKESINNGGIPLSPGVPLSRQMVD